MLYHLHVDDRDTLSVSVAKAMMVWLMERDVACPPCGSARTPWMMDLNEEARKFLPPSMRFVHRSSIPTPTSTLLVKVWDASSVSTVLELLDGDLRKQGLRFDFPDDARLRFRATEMEVEMSDADWTLALLSDTSGQIVGETMPCS